MEQMNVIKDPTQKRIVIERRFSAGVDKVWQAWTTAELLVRWWGPKTWPASSASFDFRPGGHWHYYMTGPDGTQAWGWIDYLTIKRLESFEANDYFSDAQGNKSTEAPFSRWLVDFKSPAPGLTLVIVTLNFETVEGLNKMLEMGFEAGFGSALENLEELLAAGFGPD